MKSPIVQNDERLNADINKAGCLFRSLLMIAEVHVGKLLETEEIAEAYDNLVRLGKFRFRGIDPQKGCYVNNHEDVINTGLMLLGRPDLQGVYLESVPMDASVGAYKNKGVNLEPTYFVRHFKTISHSSGKVIGHFVYSDRERHMVWNPYWPATPIINEMSFRKYAVRKVV